MYGRTERHFPPRKDGSFGSPTPSGTSIAIIPKSCTCQICQLVAWKKEGAVDRQCENSSQGSSRVTAAPAMGWRKDPPIL